MIKCCITSITGVLRYGCGLGLEDETWAPCRKTTAHLLSSSVQIGSNMSSAIYSGEKKIIGYHRNNR